MEDDYTNVGFVEDAALVELDGLRPIPRQHRPQFTARQIDPSEGAHGGRARTAPRVKPARVEAGAAKGIVARRRGTRIGKSQRMLIAELEAETALGVGIGFRPTLAPADPLDRDGFAGRSAVRQHDLPGKENRTLELRLIESLLLLAHTAERTLLPGTHARPSLCRAARLPPRGITGSPGRPPLLSVGEYGPRQQQADGTKAFHAHDLPPVTATADRSDSPPGIRLTHAPVLHQASIRMRIAVPWETLFASAPSGIGPLFCFENTPGLSDELPCGPYFHATGCTKFMAAHHRARKGLNGRPFMYEIVHCHGGRSAHK